MLDLSARDGRMAVLALSAAALAALAVTPGASAQPAADDGVSGSISLGGALVPDYEGSDDYEPAPFGGFSLQYRGYVLESRGLGVQADLIPDPQWAAGPLVTYNGGRDDVEDTVVDRLRDVDESVEIGGFLEYRMPAGLVDGDGLSFGLALRQDIAGGHDGLIGEGSVGYSAPVSDRLRLTGAFSTTVVSDDYSEAFFSVDAADADASGLPVFDAEGGFKDVGLTLVTSYSFSESWGVDAIANYTRLVGDAADSPIVDRQGSADQFLLGLSVRYAF